MVESSRRKPGRRSAAWLWCVKMRRRAFGLYSVTDTLFVWGITSWLTMVATAFAVGFSSFTDTRRLQMITVTIACVTVTLTAMLCAVAHRRSRYYTPQGDRRPECAFPSITEADIRKAGEYAEGKNEELLALDRDINVGD